MSRTVSVEELQGLLGRGLCYRWAARLFAYPNDELVSALRSGRAQAQLAAACPTLEHPSPVSEKLATLWTAWEESQAGELFLDQEHTYLFARHVLAPPYESRYREGAQLSLGHDLSQVSSFYAAFGFQVAERAGELPDHLSLELEFVAALYLKEAYALERGWHARARMTREARVKFLGEHLAWWVDAFAEKVREKARLPFYPAAVSFLQALLAQEQMPEAEAFTSAASSSR